MGEDLVGIDLREGYTINKVLNIGKRGQIQTSFFYAGGDMTKAPKVTTIIPKVFKKK